MTVTTADIVTEEAVRRVVEEAAQENLVFRQAYRDLDISGIDNDTITIPVEADDLSEPKLIPENADFPREEESTNTQTYTVQKYGHEIAVSMEAESDSVFDVVAHQIERKARQMNEKLNDLAHNHLSNNLHSSSPTSNAGSTSALEFADVMEAKRVLQNSGHSPDILFVSPQGHMDLATQDFTPASDLGDETLVEGSVGRVGGVDILVDNDGHIGGGTSDGFLVDSDQYGYEIMKGGINTDEYEDPSRQARVFQIWVRVVYGSTDDSAAIKVGA